MKFLVLVWFAMGLCRAQEPIAVPVIGKMLDGAGSLRTVYGVGGTFTVGPPAMARVISAACSAELCLAKTAAGVVGPKGPTAAAAGPALIAVNGAEALLYFPESNEFAHWREGRLWPLPWRVEGEVVALRAARGDDNGAEIAVRRGAEVWIVRPDGAILDYLGEVAGPVLLLDSAVVRTSGDELILRRGAEDELRFELPGAQSLSALGPEYVQVNTADARYALRVTPGREKLLLLPAPRKEAVEGRVE